MSNPIPPSSRREFLAAVSASALIGGWPLSDLAAQEENSRPLRAIAYNVYACTGWPKDRPLAERAVAEGQMPDRFAMELALHAPDIVTFSESPDEDTAREIAERLGMKHVRFPSGLHWPGTLLTRFEVVDSENAPVVGRERPEDLFTRHWGRATLRLPGGESLIIHSAHLHPSESEIRQREIAAMLESMEGDTNAGRSMLLMGDLNHTPDTPEHRMWTEAGWVDTFSRVGEGDGPTIKADEPTRRIDYIMAIGPIAERITASRPLFEGAFRTDPADPASFALSDHLPQLAVFRG